MESVLRDAYLWPYCLLTSCSWTLSACQSKLTSISIFHSKNSNRPYEFEESVSKFPDRRQVRSTVAS